MSVSLEDFGGMGMLAELKMLLGIHGIESSICVDAAVFCGMFFMDDKSYAVQKRVGGIDMRDAICLKMQDMPDGTIHFFYSAEDAMGCVSNALKDAASSPAPESKGRHG